MLYVTSFVNPVMRMGDEVAAAGINDDPSSE
jgi:hypothetical protein